MTYWFETIPIRSDYLILFMVRIVKYAPVILFFIAGRTLQVNYCMVENFGVTI